MEHPTTRSNDPNVFPCLEGGVHRWEAVWLLFGMGRRKADVTLLHGSVVGDERWTV
jgi:hypothetical protein